MLGVRDVRVILIGVVVFGVAVRADMVSVLPMDVECRTAADTYSTEEIRAADYAGLYDFQSLVDTGFETIRFSPGAGGDYERIRETQHPRILTDQQSSLSLCLSALVGLGLCSSARSLKKLHFGFIPEWYHNGGPWQIGYSLAVNPDSVRPISGRCFIQPTYTAEDLESHYCSGTIVSLWRKSQFTLDVIASRAPPTRQYFMKARLPHGYALLLHRFTVCEHHVWGRLEN